MREKLKKIPVPILPTVVGACTLATVYESYGYTWIIHFTMLVATLLLLAYLGKIITSFSTFQKEYARPIQASLYAGFSMILMILGSYYFAFQPTLGKGIWVLGIGIHVLHIFVFTYRNVVHGVKMESFMPSWFMTYNGIMVSTVVGGAMKEAMISNIIVYYGIGVFTILLPFMIYRLIKLEIKDNVYHTQAIMIAPGSLCLVSYLNVIQNQNVWLVSYLYATVMISLIVVLYKLPAFFRYPFTPSYASLTFPMAIGIVASLKFSAYAMNNDMEHLAHLAKEIAGVQLYITTGILAYVLFQFFIMFRNAMKTA